MKTPVVAAVLAMAAAAVLLLYGRDEGDGDAPYNGPDLIDQATELWQQFEPIPGDPEVQNRNLNAFMMAIRTGEGTAGPDGYRTLVGGSLFDSYADHPRIMVFLPKLGISSSAAGAYQILRRTWDEVAASLGLTDFTPASQDRACVKLISRRGALNDVLAGRFAVAVEKCRKEWASLPGAGYGQREESLANLQAVYIQNGGVLA